MGVEGLLLREEDGMGKWKEKDDGEEERQNESSGGACPTNKKNCSHTPVTQLCDMRV